MYYSRLSTSQMIQNGLDGIYRNQGLSNASMLELSTGKRTDLDPVEEAQLLNYKVSIKNQTQNNRNIDNIMPKFEAQENSITTIQDHLTLLQERLMRFNNSITAGEKEVYAEEYKGIKQSIIQNLNSKDIYGEYLFSGHQSGIKPFDEKINYLGDKGISEIRIADNTTMQINTVGDQVATNNLKNVIEKLDMFFSTKDAQIDTTVFDDLEGSLDDLSINLTKIGNRLNRLDSTKISNEDIIYTNTAKVSSIEDVDMAKAASDFSKAQTAYQAALKTHAAIQQLSLFNYV